MIRRTATALLPIALLATCGGGGSTEAAHPGPRHVFLISLDTLRSDHCSLYGYGKPTTPFLEELAARGVVFDNHMANSNNTLTSHATMMTGLVPQAHDTYDKGAEKRQKLAKSYRTVAEVFGEAGFATGSFNTHPTWLGEEFGVMQGFDELEASWSDAPSKTGEFLDWYDGKKPERMFVFLHFYDAHSESTSIGGVLPYDSSEELIAQFAGEKPKGFTGCLKNKKDHCTSLYLQGVNDGVEELPPDHLEYLKGLYDAGIRKLDDDLRVFFDKLEERGILKDSLIVITSDHGEDFMEHGTLLHGTVYDPIMHVPMIILLPEGVEPERVHITEGTRMIDVAPTMLDFAGLQRIGQGDSLVPVIMGGEQVNETEAFFSPAVLRSHDEHGLFKMFDLPKEPLFFDLEADPGEMQNIFENPELLAEYQDRIDAARKRIRTWRADSFRARDRLKKPDDEADTGGVELDEDAMEQLRRLGYIEAGGGEDESEDEDVE
jgi:arylsulfatase A-like enzyme